MMRGSRLRNIGWMMVLGGCVGGYLVLSFHVGSIKGQVHLAEREIVALEREKIVLETEFETRANQQQLADWNRIEFGYQPPHAGQYLESERQLASLGEPKAFDAPDPIRVAQTPIEENEGLLAMVSPITGEPMEDSGISPSSGSGPHGEDGLGGAQNDAGRGGSVSSGGLADRLAREIALPAKLSTERAQ